MPRWLFSLPLEVKPTANDTSGKKRWGRSRERAEIRERINELVGERLELLAVGDETMDWQIHLVRLGPRLMDTDNLANAFKTHRDAIAHHLGRDDRKGTGLHWTYDQRRQKDTGMEVLLILDPSRCSGCGQLMPVDKTVEDT
jgi:hypothetical protein